MTHHPVISARGRHVPHIVARWKELMAVHRDLDPVLYALRPDAPSVYAEQIEAHLTKSRSMVLVAPAGGEDEDAIHGYLLGGLGNRSSVYAVRAVGMIWDLAVQPGARRAGVGRALVESAVRRFRARGLRYVQVTYAPGNPLASAFWGRMGFQTLLNEAYLPL